MIDTTNLGALTPLPEGGKSLLIPFHLTSFGKPQSAGELQR
jgi:hypothetical protein